jgi:hypothetical protein
MVISRTVSFIILCLVLLDGAPKAAAQPGPVLNSPLPVAVQRGQTIDVALTGQNLGAVTSSPMNDARGISVSLVTPQKPNPAELHLKIAAAADAALGGRELRLVGPAGVTQPLHVFVSQYPVVMEKEPNNSAGEAQELSLPATLLGRIDALGDVDVFRFNAAKGEQLIFDAQVARAGSSLDPVIMILSTDGREQHVTVEHHEGDPVLIFQVPEDGQYFLRLRDLRYRGGADYDYRIVAGQIPYVETILPSSGEPGSVITAQAIGYNLDGGEKIAIDLSNSAPGTIEVRAKTSRGVSNPMPFEVTELPQAVESEPNDSREKANVVSAPTEISAHIDRPGDIDFFKFHMAYKQVMSMEVLSGNYGSPVTALLQLRNAHGDVIENNDGTPDADARIVRELDAGDYIVSVRDLIYAGGPGYWYRLKIEPAAHVPQDFSVRFMPDAPRLHRGGNAAMWCLVSRIRGFKGDVTITPEGLPAGVTAEPITLPEGGSGWFTLGASPDAALGPAPIRLRASATIGTATVSHYAEPMIEGHVLQQAYLTVLEPSPFNVEAVAKMTPQRLEQMNAEIAALAAKLYAPDPKFDASLAEWEKKVSDRPAWTVLDSATAASAKSTPLDRQPDGSFLASGNFPAQDEYTVTAHTNLKGITGVRLEVLADDRLPGHGPGVAPNGNFVLTEFKLLANKEGQPSQPVGLKNPMADFSQPKYPVSAAIDDNPATGWAVDPQQGRNHTATFQTASPVGFDEGTTLTFVLEHQSEVASHNIGRFRLSITTADPAMLKEQTQLPAEILAIIAKPTEQRSAEQKTELANYFRRVDPDHAADRNRMEAMRSFVEPYAEMERLEKILKAETPELKKEQEQWEKEIAGGAGWSILPVTRAKSDSGTHLQRESDGSIFAEGATPPTDTYELTANTPLKRITAVRLEVLPDPRLPGNGPGRAGDGNFVLTHFHMSVAPKQSGASDTIEFESAGATVEQEKYDVAATLVGKDDTGWAIAPNTGRPAAATFYPKEPIPNGSLAIVLEQHSKLPQHTIGRFRLWVTTNAQPDSAQRPPEAIAAMLRTKTRSPEQQRELATYFRSIAPSLDPLRERLADLRTQVPSLPLRLEKGRDGAIPVPINRLGNFTGDVQVTLEGFAGGLSLDGNKPAPISRDLKINPLTIAGDKLFGTLTFQPARNVEVGTGMVILKAEAKVGSETITEYSPAFPLTVEK